MPRDVTYERLLNPEPQNWLTHHRDFNAQRYSPLELINKSNVKNLKLISRSRSAANPPARALEATPWSTTGSCTWSKLGHRLQDRRAVRHRREDRLEDGPQVENQDRNRGAALWGNLVISVTGYARPRHRDRQGHRQDRLGQEPARSARPRTHRRAARAQGLRSWSAAPVATAACATGWRRSIRRPARSNGRPIPSRHRASPAARPGRTTTTPGRPAAARSSAPAPTIPPPI